MSLKSLLLSIISLIPFITYAGAPVPSGALAPATQSATNIVVTKPLSEKPALNFINAWARPSMTETGKISKSAAYVTIQNDSDIAYKLVNVASSAANQTEIHQTFTDEKNVTKMVKLDNLNIPAKNTTELKPGGIHIMLIDLKRPLNIGDMIDLAFYFDDGSSETIKVKIANN